MTTGIMAGFGTALMMFALPVMVLFWMYLKGMKQGFNALIGVCVYFNFYALIFTVVIIGFGSNYIPALKTVLSYPAGMAFFYAVIGGICCEFGRYLGLRFGLGEKHRSIDAIGLGIGYGFAANIPYVRNILMNMAVIRLVKSSVSSLGESGFIDQMVENGIAKESAEEMLELVNSLNFSHSVMYCIQIIATYCFAIALSLLVLGVLRKNLLFENMPFLCVWIAAAAHILTDGVPILMQQMLTDANTNYYIAMYLILVGAGAIWLIRRAFLKYADDPYDAEEGGKTIKKKKIKTPQQAGTISANAQRRAR